MNAFKKTLVLLTFILTVTFTWAQTDIHCNGSGDWDDASNWDLARTPQPGDIVHIDAPGSIVTKFGPTPINIYEIHVDNNSTLSLNYAGVLNVSGSGLIHIDNGSILNVNCPTVCTFLHLDNRSSICLNAAFTCCFMVLDNVSNFYGNGNDVNISNCSSQYNPLQINNGSKFSLNKDCNGKTVKAGKLTVNGNLTINDCSIIYNDITVSNGTFSTGSCNTTINGTLTLNTGGDFTTTGTLTYGSNAKLAFNRDYTLTGSSKIWGTGITASNVPPTVEILSGTISTNDTLCVKRRINLLGGVVGTSSGTKIKLANDTEYVCGGRFQSTPTYGSNVVILTCSPIQINIVSQTNETYFGGSTGSVTLTATAGIAPYLWSIDGINFQTSPTFSGLAAGTYTITCKDVNGVSATKIVTITQPALLVPSVVSQTNETYFGGSTGSVTVTATGGVGPYTWSKDGINFQSSATFNGLTAGAYTFTCKDANGVTKTTSATITQPALLVPSVVSQTNETYFGGSTGSVTVTATGGVGPYTWSKDGINFQSSATFNGLTAGAYTFTCKDANGIAKTTSATITQPAILLPSIVSQTNILCYWQNTGSVTLSSSGGTSPYTWSKDGINFQTSSTFSSLGSGIFTITVKDSNGVTSSTTVTITKPSTPFTTSVTSQTNVSCYGAAMGSISMSGTGGITPYTWSKDGINFQTSSSFTNLPAGSYTIKGKDANGCIETKFVTITQPSTALSASVSTSSNCITGNNGSATVTVTGGIGSYSYLWNTSPAQTTATASGLLAGTYTVTVTDGNNCSINKTITITAKPQDFAYTTNYQTTTQPLIGNSFTFTEFGTASGETYNWDFGDGSTSTLASPTKSYSNYGVYNARLIATNTSGCSDTSYQTVVVLATNKSTSTIPVCDCGTNSTVSQTIIFPTSTTDWSGTNLKIRKAAKFNSSLGNLTGVKVISNGAFTTHNKVEITGTMATGTKRLVNIQTTGTMVCGGPGYLYGINPPMILDTFSSTGFDGIKDFAGTSGKDFGYHTSSALDFTSFTDAPTLASYTGSDSVSFTAYTSTNMSATFPTGNDTASMQTTATDTVTLIYYYCNPTISSIKTGNWNDPTTWDAGRVPTACDNVHIRNTDSVTISSGNHSICQDITCDGTSKFYIYDTLTCRIFNGNNLGNVTKVYGKLNVCSMNLNNNSKVYACDNVTFSNCTNAANPLSLLNGGQLLPHGAPLCSEVKIEIKVDGKNVDLTNLCSANISIKTLTITNATVTLDTCNHIVDYIILNQGGDVVGHAPTWVGQSKLAINRNYTFDSSSLLWQVGTSNVPHNIDILSGNININNPKTVVTRMQLLGGTVFGGTNLVFASNSYLFRCGGILNQPASMGTNVTVEMCSDTNSNNPPATIGSTDMPPGGFTGDLIISTNVVLAGNVFVPAGKVIVTGTGVLNDSNFTVSQATQVNALPGGTIITTKSGGLTGPNSLLGSLPTTLSPTSTVIYGGASGTQTVSQGTTYGNIIFTDTAAKTILPGTTTVAGDFTVANGSGTVTAAPGSTIVFNGDSQQISGINFQNVTFSGTGTSSITSTATVTKNMDVTSGVVINTNNNLTLLSGPSGTAQLGALTNGADVLGNVCWLRYIPGGPSNRRWRFLSNPVLNVTFRWWQNDIFITGPGTGGVPCAWNTTSNTSMTQNSNGFDQNQSLVNSCFTWNETSNSWQTIPSTFNTINPLKAYRTFVRGDRNIEGCLLMTNMPDSVSGVTLHTCGPIVKFTQTAPLTYTPGIGNGWNYVSNPFPCSIDWWNSSWVASRSSSIVPTLYIWVPEKNQYATWSPLAGGVNGGTNIIGTGQSFFIKTNAATNLVFQETYKVDSGQIGFFGKTGTNTVSNNLKMKLTSNTTADEALVYINSNASLNYEETYDAYKMGFTTGSIASSTKLNASKLVFNAIGIVRTMDTINLNTYLASASTNYTLDFSGANTFDPQYLILLRDKYLSVITNLMVNRVYTFSTNSSVSGSFDQNRFELIILNSSALPVTLSDFNAEKQTDKSVLVKWSTASESNNSHFIVEHSLDAVNFKPLEVVKGAGNSNSLKNYSYSHMNPSVGMNYYRLTQVDFNNNKHESFIVAVNFTEEKPGTVSLFPVPVSNTLNVNFNNSDYSGNVVVKIYDIVGREMMTQQISVNSNNPVYGIDVSTLNSGSYIISISSNKSQEQKIKFVKD